MRAYVINPAHKRIESVDIDGNDFKLIGALIGHRPLVCIYPKLKPGKRYVVWLDDEGLIRKPAPALWEIAGIYGPLAGTGVLFGLTKFYGDNIACDLSLAEVKRLVIWRPDLEFLRLATSEADEDTPLGKMRVIRSEAKFGTKREAR